jgi:hypothetical protein
LGELILDKLRLLRGNLTSNNSIVNAVRSIWAKDVLWHVKLLLGVLLGINRHIWWWDGLHLSSSFGFFLSFCVIAFEHALNKLCFAVALIGHELLGLYYS